MNHSLSFDLRGRIEIQVSSRAGVRIVAIEFEDGNIIAFEGSETRVREVFDRVLAALSNNEG